MLLGTVHFISAVSGNRPLAALTINEGDQLDGKPSVTGTMRGDVADLHWRSAWGDEVD